MLILLKQIFAQGILEAFPLSSSMHLRIFNFSNIEIMHLGTGLAFFAYSLEYLLPYFKQPFSKKTRIFTLKMILLILPTSVIGFYFGKQPLFFSPDLVNLISALFMIFVNIKCKDTKNFKSLSNKEMMFIGFIISFAILPGASRFGISYSAFRLFKLSKYESFIQSIIVGIPITIGAALFSMTDQKITNEILIISLIAGFITYQTLKLTKKFLNHWNFFAIYRIIFSFINFFLKKNEKKKLVIYVTTLFCYLFNIELNINKSLNNNKKIFHSTKKINHKSKMFG